MGPPKGPSTPLPFHCCLCSLPAALSQFFTHRTQLFRSGDWPTSGAPVWPPLSVGRETLISTWHQELILSPRVRSASRSNALTNQCTRGLLLGGTPRVGGGRRASSPYLQSSFSSAPPNVYTFHDSCFRGEENGGTEQKWDFPSCECSCHLPFPRIEGSFSTHQEITAPIRDFTPVSNGELAKHAPG